MAGILHYAFGLCRKKEITLCTNAVNYSLIWHFDGIKQQIWDSNIVIVSEMYDISKNMKPTFQNYSLQRPIVAKLIIRASVP